MDSLRTLELSLLSSSNSSGSSTAGLFNRSVLNIMFVGKISKLTSSWILLSKDKTFEGTAA